MQKLQKCSLKRKKRQVFILVVMSLKWYRMLNNTFIIGTLISALITSVKTN